MAFSDKESSATPNSRVKKFLSKKACKIGLIGSSGGGGGSSGFISIKISFSIIFSTSTTFSISTSFSTSTTTSFSTSTIFSTITSLGFSSANLNFFIVEKTFIG